MDDAIETKEMAEEEEEGPGSASTAASPAAICRYAYILLYRLIFIGIRTIDVRTWMYGDLNLTL